MDEDVSVTFTWSNKEQVFDTVLDALATMTKNELVLIIDEAQDRIDDIDVPGSYDKKYGGDT